MTIKNGDLPAMPLDGDAELQSAFNRSETYGLTKREYFAALAMQGMLNGMMCNADVTDLAIISKKSVKAADALLAELGRTGGQYDK